MKILICGHGFVGKAHGLFLSSHHDIKVYDPQLGYKDTTVFDDADAVIIAVSTPEGEDGQCDMSNVYDAIERIMPGTPVLIKSTVSLEGWRLINRAYPDEFITFSPEYLRADYAMEDFKNQKSIAVGGGDVNLWVGILSDSLEIRVDIMNPEVLILNKYFRNAFLAMKVAFFEQMYDMAITSGVDPHELLATVSDDKRIGKSHTYINTNDRGFGGHCFPKDTSALLSTGHQMGYDLSILSEAMQYNERLRNEKNII